MEERTEGNVSRAQLEQEVFAAVEAFEQILEAMPEDRASLEALAHAYKQLGDAARSREYLLRLVRVVLRESDPVSADELVERLEALGPDDEEARELLGDIRALLARTEMAGENAPAEDASETALSVSPGLDLSDEIALAWQLLKSGEISQDEYAGLIEDLTEMSSGDSTATVSLLHVMEGRQFKGLERILGRLAEVAGTPYVALDAFTIPDNVAALLPLEFMVRRGAVAFEMVGKHMLVAVLNPYDKRLRRDVQNLLGCACHFYLTRASDFDLTIARMMEVGVKKLTEP